MIQYNHKRKYERTPFLEKHEGFRLEGEHIQLTPSSKGGETIALQVIEPWFFDMLKQNDFFEKAVGFARCSDDDNYNKKTGRELATTRMKPRRLVVKDIQGVAENRIIVLIDKDNNHYFLSKKENCGVHFIEFINGKE